MKFQIGAMSVGDILDRGLKLLLARLPTFYLINLIVLAPLILVQLALPALREQPAGGPSQGQVFGILGGAMLVLALTLILQPFGTAAMLHVIAQEFIEQPSTVGAAFAFALRRFLRLLGTSIMVGLVVMLGTLLCIVPGILFAIWYIFAAQVVVVEGLGGNKAMERSKELTSGCRTRVLGLVILFFVISMVLGFASSSLNFILPSSETVTTSTGPRTVMNYGNYAIQVVVTALLNILVQTYAAICYTLFYFDLRIRKEGFDLELAAREQASVVS